LELQKDFSFSYDRLALYLSGFLQTGIYNLSPFRNNRDFFNGNIAFEKVFLN
jgi:hypothetical protein